jgi:hypothetical protein
MKRKEATTKTKKENKNPSKQFNLSSLSIFELIDHRLQQEKER